MPIALSPKDKLILFLRGAGTKDTANISLLMIWVLLSGQWYNSPIRGQQLQSSRKVDSKDLQQSPLPIADIWILL